MPPGHYGNRLETVSPCACVTWDICGRRLISRRLMACGSRLLSNWQSSTPSLRAWARSQTWHHTREIRQRRWRRRLGSLQVCDEMKRPSHLCTFPCHPVVIRKDSTVDQPRRTLPPQLHLCFLNSIQKDRSVRVSKSTWIFQNQKWVDVNYSTFKRKKKFEFSKFLQMKVWIKAIIAWNSHIPWLLMTKGT